MALIKKTVVLSGSGALGYASVIQVGSETGVKVVGDFLTDGMRAVIRIGNKKYAFDLIGPRTEISIQGEVGAEDDVGCLIAKNGTLVAKGGAYLSLGDLDLRDREATPPPTAEQTAATDTPSENGDDQDNEILERLKKEKDRYYHSVKDKVDELFVVNPAEPQLSGLIPDSEWVKIRYDGEDYYVVGKLYDENGKVRYLGYGVPGIASVRPPKVADGIATFLALKEGSDRGYWLFFQNAENGKIE